MCDAAALRHRNLTGNVRGNIVIARLAKGELWEKSLTVKETMLDTRVDKAEGMNVSCLGIGLMRRPTFCRAVASALS